MLWLAGGIARRCCAQVRASTAPAQRMPAAVLVPLVERDRGLTVLLTQRAATLKDHAGQISFPGGRIEPQDADAWQAALREAHEEIGLARELRRVRRLPAGSLGRHGVSRDAGGRRS